MHFPKAKFCPTIYRNIARSYYLLKTCKSMQNFEIEFPLSELWYNAGFGPEKLTIYCK